MALWNFMDVPCALGTGFVREAHERFQRHCCIQRSAHPRWPYLPTEKPCSKPRMPGLS